MHRGRIDDPGPLASAIETRSSAAVVKLDGAD